MPAADETALRALGYALAGEAVKLRLAVLARACKANFNPNQPRVPAGNPDGGQWTSGGGGSHILSDAAPDNAWKPGAQYAQNAPRPPRGGGRPVLVNGRWVQPTTVQSVRLAAAQLRADAALARVRTLDANWRPRPSAYESIEGLIQRTDAMGREAQVRFDQLRSGIGGNFGPPLTPPAASGTSSNPRFDGPAWIEAYRAVHTRRDLFGNPTWRADEGTVSVAEFDGRTIYGVNSDAPTYTAADRTVAQRMVNSLIQKYPGVMKTDNVGQKPNDALYHAEATILLRAAHANGGTLADRVIIVHSDRSICRSCDTVLPKLSIELGNPTVTYIDRSYLHTLKNGHWISRIRR